jgi:hypothetical protein
VRIAIEIIGVHRPLLGQLLGNDRVEGEHPPRFWSNEEAVPRRRWNANPALSQAGYWAVRVAGVSADVGTLGM